MTPAEADGALFDGTTHCSEQLPLVWQRSTASWALHITDDGIGFDLVKAARREKSVGLLSMRERAELIGGSLQVQSMPGKGTAVTLLLPTRPSEAPTRIERGSSLGREA